jgi:hypothetical protein
MRISDGLSARFRSVRSWLLGAALMLAAVPAGAVMQTNGPVIPLVPGTGCESNVGICINTNEVAEGGNGDIDPVANATISQETFNPLCELTFTVVARGASYQNTFGWYEVKRDTNGAPLAPMLSELHVFLGCGDVIGTTKTLTIPAGVTEIGFFLANNGNSCVATQDDPLGPTLTMQPDNMFLSQRQFNSDGNNGDNLIHLLVWQSHANPNAFYFGWEDLKGGGDNDFEDLLTYVTGIQCASGGEPCHIDGEDGVCGDGVQQCRDGMLTCVPTQTPSPEKCNGLDDDCSGETDEGDLCDAGEICVHGHCEPKCGTGEFRCAGGDVCVDGVCIEASCATKDCPDGSVCRDGTCVAPCDDVVCPYGATCRRGVCVDACEGVKCDPGFACEVRESSDQSTLVGVCSSCDCRGCGDGQSCDEHLCVEDLCKDQNCAAGSHCVAGDCVDNCKDAKCPSGQICSLGSCVGDPNGGDGGANSGEGGDDGGGGTLNPGVGAFGGNGNGNGNAGGTNGSDGGSNGSNNSLEVKGCSCELPGQSGSGRTPLVLLGLALAAAGVRARRRR